MSAETIYVGRSRTGRRLHFVAENGWAGSCGRDIGDAKPIEDAKPPVDADWCRTCMREAARMMWLAAKLAAVDPRSPRREADVAPTREAERWDADTEIEMGETILAHLERHPAPEGSLTANDWDDWGQGLVAAGNRRLDDLERGDA
jgi:hypothetical protein